NATAIPIESEIYIDPVVEKRLLRKLDFRLISFAFFSYFTSNLVRNNMQNAYTNGMDVDVGIDSEAYNWCVTFFFIGYIIPQILQIFKTPNAVWGLRFIMGMAQATFVPSMVFIIGSWYTNSELATRTAIFMAGNQMSGAIGGIIAAGASWQWLFIIEGLMSIFVGLVGYYLLPNYPHNTNWVQGEEKDCAIARLERQGKQLKSQKYTWDTFLNVLATPYAYLLTLDFICINIGNQIPLNFSIIMKKMGYDANLANYLSPPSMYGERAWIIIIVQIWVAVWYLVLFAVNHAATPFWLLMLSSFAIINNISMFPLEVTDAPEFFLGKVVTFALSVASVIITFVCWWCLKHNVNLPRVRDKKEQPEFPEWDDDVDEKKA
ncbi:major facilitator superfamily domain-containing protein, partial [Mucor lusitanicus]